jgi:hypothetical protein
VTALRFHAIAPPMGDGGGGGLMIRLVPEPAAATLALLAGCGGVALHPRRMNRRRIGPQQMPQL